MNAIAPPLIAYVVGITLSELYQWAGYWKKNPDQPRTAYWKMGLPHGLGNLAGDVIVCVLWAYGGLDWVLTWAAKAIPGSADWAASGVPYTPEMGILVGFGVDLFSDNLTFLVRKIITSRAPGLVPPAAPAAAPPEP